MEIRVFGYERDTVNNTISLFPTPTPTPPSTPLPVLHTILSINDRQKLIFPLD